MVIDWLFVDRRKAKNNEKGPWGGVSIQKRSRKLKEQTKFQRKDAKISETKANTKSRRHKEKLTF